MRRTTLMTAGFLAMACRAAADPPLADEIFEPLIASTLIESFSTDDGWEIMDGGVERFDHTRVSGKSWLVQALAMQIEPAEAMPEVYLENLMLNTSKNVLVELEILALFLAEDLTRMTSLDMPVGQALFGATPSGMQQVCALMSAPVSAMGEGVTFTMDGFEVGKIAGFKSRVQILPGKETCTLRTIAQATDLQLETPDGRTTEIGVISIVSEGPALAPELRSSSVILDQMTLTRGGETVKIKGLSEVFRGSFQLSFSDALYRVATGDVSGIHDAMDVVAAFADGNS